MLEGKYQVILKTPMGAKKGELLLKNENSVLTGSMTALGKTNALTPEQPTANVFSSQENFRRR